MLSTGKKCIFLRKWMDTPCTQLLMEKQYVYDFEANNRPGIYWFHPHPDEIPRPQVYRKLAGMFIVEGLETNLPSNHRQEIDTFNTQKIKED